MREEVGGRRENLSLYWCHLKRTSVREEEEASISSLVDDSRMGKGKKKKEEKKISTLPPIEY